MISIMEMYELDVTEKIGKEYIPMVEDITRMFILQVFVQFMMFIRNPNENGLFDANFIEMLLYIILGLCVYWLVFKKLIKIK